MAKSKQKQIPTPQEFKAELDKVVIGQDEAKKILSVAVYNHYKRLLYGYDIDKSNILLTGPTGCGKTLLVRTLAQMLDVPCYIQDCTKLTASGYVGSDVEDCVAGLLRASNYVVPRAEKGIVMLDEIDKVAARSAGPSITRDVSGECVQQSLLKIVEGDLVGVQPQGGRKHPEQSLTYINTRDILFIASGAFVGLEDIVRRRIGGARHQIGFAECHAATSVTDEQVRRMISTVDIRDFGFIPEFVGRFPIITSVSPLSKSDLRDILTNPVNSIIEQYTNLLLLDNTLITFSSEALDKIAETAWALGTGARSLKNIVDTVMTDLMFDAPQNLQKRTQVKLSVTKAMVTEKLRGKFQPVSVA